MSPTGREPLARPPDLAGTARIFAYGFLLPGQPLDAALSGHVVAEEEAFIAARLHWHVSGRFPVAIEDPGSRTHGRVITVEAAPEIFAVLGTEEIAVGYDARWVVPRSPDGAELLPALAFLWPWGSETVGPAITSGRFVDA